MIFMSFLCFLLIIFPPLFPSFCCPFPADTKLKVEQISEELRNLDEMLAGNDGANGAVETAGVDATSLHDNSDQLDGKGLFFDT